jgi:hypothetical protein
VVVFIGFRANLHTNFYKLLQPKPFKNKGLETSTNFYTPLATTQRERENNIYKIYIYIKIPLRRRDSKGYVEVCRSLLSALKTKS